MSEKIVVQWHPESETPGLGFTLVTLRGSGMSIETYHGGGVWTHCGRPTLWAYWDSEIDIGGALSQERFDVLSRVQRPEEIK